MKSNHVMDVVQYPATEMPINSPRQGWAEQDPEVWWKNLIRATELLLMRKGDKVISQILGIGISYQMHGLVLLGKHGEVLRPSIIWCDSRAVEIGNLAAQNIGEEVCFDRMLNHPGNFTASKFKWVQDNEPDVYNKVKKIMLPGDFLAFKMTGEINTTPSGLSEGILWDFKNNRPASFAFDVFGIKEDMIPSIVNTFSRQGYVSSEAASLLGIPKNIPVCYRAGDQPNNAMSLGAIEAGEIAATGGTSGVVYGVMDHNIVDRYSRINSFAHVNYTNENQMTGVLLCINGAGSFYRWVRETMTGGMSTYDEMEALASKISIGSDGLVILPFGNGAERMLCNKDLGAQILSINLNRYSKNHIYRASLEGVAFSFVYGVEILKELGVNIELIKAGNDNLFRSNLFSTVISTLLKCEIHLVDTTGAIGAAKAVGYTLGIRTDLKQAMSGNKIEKVITPVLGEESKYQLAYKHWKNNLEEQLNRA